MTDELYHHGIKGQKWGVRRYQNSDGSLTEEGRKRYRDSSIQKRNSYKFKQNMYQGYANMNDEYDVDKYDKTTVNKKLPDSLHKGSTVRHITTNKDFAEDVTYPDADKRLFVYYDDIDDINYAGFYAAWRQSKNKNTYKAEMELKESLNIAHKNDQYNAFKTLIQDDPKFAKELANDIARYLKKFDDEYGADVNGNKKYVIDSLHNGKKEDLNRIFKWLNSYGPYEYGKSYDKWINEISKKYNAIDDLNDMDPYNMMGSVHPIIILRVMSTIGNTKLSEITKEDIVQKFNELT